jgi:2TM domain
MYDDRESRRAQRRAYKDARRAARWNLNNEPPESLENLSGPELDAAIRRRIERRVRDRREFFVGLASFVAVNTLLWIIWLATSTWYGGFPWPIFPTLGWGIGVAVQGWQVYQNSATAVSRREETIQHEIALEKMRLGLDKSADDYEKPKRDHVVRLSDDGELVADEGNTDVTIDKAKNS